jgi:antitoxin HicB
MKREELRLSEYPFTIRPLTADEGGGYLIEFPDVPLCIMKDRTENGPVFSSLSSLQSDV